MRAGTQWEKVYEAADKLPTPEGFESLFNRGEVDVFKADNTVHVLFKSSSDYAHIIPVAQKIDPKITCGNWGGDLIVSFHSEPFDTYVRAGIARAGNTVKPALRQ
jgi:hypothetical protein